MLSSNANLPLSWSNNIEKDVNCLETDARLKIVEGVLGISYSRLAIPKAFLYTTSSFCRTRTEAPGVSGPSHLENILSILDEIEAELFSSLVCACKELRQKIVNRGTRQEIIVCFIVFKNNSPRE